MTWFRCECSALLNYQERENTHYNSKPGGGGVNASVMSPCSQERVRAGDKKSLSFVNMKIAFHCLAAIGSELNSTKTIGS